MGRNFSILQASNNNLILIQKASGARMNYLSPPGVTTDLIILNSKNTVKILDFSLSQVNSIRLFLLVSRNSINLERFSLFEASNMFENGSISYTIGERNSIYFGASIFINLVTIQPNATSLSNCRLRRLCFGGAFYLSSRGNNFTCENCFFSNISSPLGSV